MKAQVAAVLVGVLAFTQAEECKKGITFSTHDGCNRCNCDDGVLTCTTRACPPPIVFETRWCLARGDSGWLEEDCHWCTCNMDGLELGYKPSSECTREESCIQGSKEWPECSGNVSWQKDCNTCHCTRDGKAACTKYLCPAEE